MNKMKIAILKAQLSMAGGATRTKAYNDAITGSGMTQKELRQVRLYLDVETEPLHPEERPSKWLHE